MNEKATLTIHNRLFDNLRIALGWSALGVVSVWAIFAEILTNAADGGAPVALIGLGIGLISVFGFMTGLQGLARAVDRSPQIAVKNGQIHGTRLPRPLLIGDMSDSRLDAEYSPEPHRVELKAEIVLRLRDGEELRIDATGLECSAYDLTQALRNIIGLRTLNLSTTTMSNEQILAYRRAMLRR